MPPGTPLGHVRRPDPGRIPMLRLAMGSAMLPRSFRRVRRGLLPRPTAVAWPVEERAVHSTLAPQKKSALEVIKGYFLDFKVLKDCPREYWTIQAINLLDSLRLLRLPEHRRGLPLARTSGSPTSAPATSSPSSRPRRR